MSGQGVVRELLTYIGFSYQDSGFKRAEQGFQSLLGLAAELIERVDRVYDALEKLARGAGESGEKLVKTAQKLGLTTEQVQELAFAQHQSTEITTEFSNALFQLQRRSEGARRGSKEMAEGFAMLGIATTDAAGTPKPLIDLLLEVSDAFVRLPNDSQRAAAAMRLFEEGGKEMIPFLMKGSTEINRLRGYAQELGLVFSDEVNQESKKFAELTRASDAVSGLLSKTLGQRLQPAFTRIKESSIRTRTENAALLRGVIDLIVRGFERLTDTMMSTAEWVSKNRRFLATLGIVIGTLLLPKLIALTGAFAQFAIAQIIALAPTIALAAALAGIALVIEDVYVWANGGESAIGNLFEAFDRQIDAEKHPMLALIQKIVFWLRDGLTATDEFFAGFFKEAEELGGVWEALKQGFRDAMAFWWSEFAKVWSRIGATVRGLGIVARTALAATTGGLSEAIARSEIIPDSTFSNGARSAPAKIDPNATSSYSPFGQTGVPVGPDMPAFNPFVWDQFGGAPAVWQSRAAEAAPAQSVSVQGGPVSVSVTVPAGADAQAIAEQTAMSVRDELADHYQEVGMSIAPAFAY